MPVTVETRKPPKAPSGQSAAERQALRPPAPQAPVPARAAPLQVGICGSYGGLNLGDEAILQSIVSQLRESGPVEIAVFSRDADDTRKRHQVERVVPVRRLSRQEVLPEVQRLDLLIVGGGGILFDGEAKTFLREAMLARELGVPYMIYAVGVGPLRDASTQAVVRDALNGAAAITVRERAAQRELEEIGVEREIVVTADPALLLEPEPLPPDALRNEGLAGRKRLVGISVREPGPAAPDIDQDVYHELLANAADFIVDRYDADVVFVPMEHNVRDVQHSHAVIARMLRAQRATVLKGDYTSGQMLSLIGYFALAVGMRLHFLIFAALRDVPFVALPYAGKVSGLLEELEMTTPPLHLVNSGRLIAYIDQAWDQHQMLQVRARRNLPGMQQRARENNRIAIELLAARRAALGNAAPA
ncbi:MAG TPA: polysaccharide pyruvyl transferase family protein [Burkholderiaceae bacterium]|nr:polysaccharide pyruvyl transferase family protein [Burkholderiaceae bacterium]